MRETLGGKLMNVEELKKSNKHNWKLKIGILGISLFLQVAGSNLAAIPMIAKSFPFYFI